MLLADVSAATAVGGKACHSAETIERRKKRSQTALVSRKKQGEVAEWLGDKASPTASSIAQRWRVLATRRAIDSVSADSRDAPDPGACAGVG